MADREPGKRSRLAAEPAPSLPTLAHNPMKIPPPLRSTVPLPHPFYSVALDLRQQTPQLRHPPKRYRQRVGPRTLTAARRHPGITTKGKCQTRAPAVQNHPLQRSCQSYRTQQNGRDQPKSQVPSPPRSRGRTQPLDPAKKTQCPPRQHSTERNQRFQCEHAGCRLEALPNNGLGARSCESSPRFFSE